MAKKMGFLGWTTYVLITIGALAWGVYGVTGFFGEPFLLVNWLFRFDWLINTVYLLVGLLGVYALVLIPMLVYSKK